MSIRLFPTPERGDCSAGEQAAARALGGLMQERHVSDAGPGHSRQRDLEGVEPVGRNRHRPILAGRKPQRIPVDPGSMLLPEPPPGFPGQILGFKKPAFQRFNSPLQPRISHGLPFGRSSR